MDDYSFSPQFATLRSESPLAGMRPITSIPHSTLSFKEEKPFQIRSAGEEKVALGAIEGISKGVDNALKGITAAYVGERVKKEKAADSISEHERAVEIAGIRAAKTANELKIESLRIQNLEKTLDEKGANKGTDINYGSFEDETPVGNSDLPTNEDADVSNQPSLFNINEVESSDFLGQINPTQERVAALWNTPLAELTASAGTAGAQQEQALASMGAGTLTPAGQVMSTDTQPQATAPEEPRFGLMSKFRGLYTPEEAKKMRAEFSGKMTEFSGDEKMEPVPSAVGYQFDKPMRDVAPVRVEKAIPVRQASQATEKPARKDISRYVQAWADPSVASSAAEKVAEIMGSEYAYPEITQFKNKNGDVGYRVNIPKRLSGKELAELKKSTTSEGKTLLDSQINKIIALNGATEDLNSIEKRLNNIPSEWRGPVAGFFAKQNPYNAEIQALTSQIIQMIPGLARGVFGEVGVLTEKDVERYTKTIPSIEKDPKVAAQILNELREKLGRSTKSTVGAYEKAGFDVKGFKEGYFAQEKPSVDQEKQSKDSVRSEMINISKQLRDPKLDPKKKQELEKKYNDLKNSFLTK
jgi:hypothetical protein